MNEAAGRLVQPLRRSAFMSLEGTTPRCYQLWPGRQLSIADLALYQAGTNAARAWPDQLVDKAWKTANCASNARLNAGLASPRAT